MRAYLAVALVFFGLGVAPAAAQPEPSALEDPGPGLIDRHDPWETMNRGIYRFNANFDRHVFLPVLRGYRFAVPAVVRQRFSNFFRNLGQVTI